MMKTIVSKAGVVTFRHVYPDGTCLNGDDIFNDLCRIPIMFPHSNRKQELVLRTI